MKKNGYTLVELMVSITILMIILGTIGLVITSHANTYTTGMKNEETGNSFQTFYAYVIRDLTPLDEEDEENYVEVKKIGNPLEEIEIKRSWYLGTEKENVRYLYSGGKVSRAEYSSWDPNNTNVSRILSRTSNFDLTGMDIRISKSPLKYRERIANDAEYIEVSSSELESGVVLGKNESAERYSYHIEPTVKLGSGNESLEFSRGYGLRFGPMIDRTGDEEDDSQERMIWCATHEGIQVDNNGMLLSTIKSPETGKYVAVEIWGEDEDKIRWIKSNSYLLTYENGRYSGETSVPAKSEITFEIDTSGNGRKFNVKYYLYK